jgi:hypothetical protein
MAIIDEILLAIRTRMQAKEDDVAHVISYSHIYDGEKEHEQREP